MASYDPNTGLTPAQQDEQRRLYGGGYPKPPSSGVWYPWGYPGNGTTPPPGAGGSSGYGGSGPTSPWINGGGGGSGYSMPSFGDLVNGDPWFGQYKADLMAQSVADKASRDAAIQQRLIRWGEVPEGFGIPGLNNKDLVGILTPEVRTLADQNTSSGMSVKARLAQMNDDNLRNIKNVLAARGGLQSGETGYQLGRADQDYNRGVYDQKNALLDALSGIQGSYAAAEQARQQALFQAQLEAMQRAYQQWGGYGYGDGAGGGDGTYPGSQAISQIRNAAGSIKPRTEEEQYERPLTPAEEYRRNQGRNY